MIEISHGLSERELDALPMLHMANLVSEVRRTTAEMEAAIRSEPPLRVNDLLSVRSRVRIMLGEDVVNLVAGTRQSAEDLRLRLEYLHNKVHSVPLGFLGNPFVIESLTILKDVLIWDIDNKKSPPPPWLTTLRVCQSVRREELPNGVMLTQLQIPRIVKNGEGCASSFNLSADSGVEICNIDEETGATTVVNISIDGVTVPGVEGTDIIARDAALKVYRHENVQSAFVNVQTVDDILGAIELFNTAFTEEVSQAKENDSLDNPHATGAFIVTNILSGGMKRIVSAVVGDARSTAIWIDKEGELHVRTLTSPINKSFDEMSMGYARAAYKGFEKAMAILREWFKSSYMDKYNGGVGTVAVLGEESLFDRTRSHTEQRNVHVAVDSFEIPADVKYFKVFTNTDGLDLYAKLLDVPVWLADYVLTWNIHHQGQSVLKFSLDPEHIAGTLFYTPIGVAGMQGAYMIHNPDVFPPSIEPRPKIDDLHTSSCVVGSDQQIMDYLLKKSEIIKKHHLQVSSFRNELEKLSRVWYDLLGYYKLKYATDSFKKRRRRHKSTKAGK